jgi:hypothetical protein
MQVNFVFDELGLVEKLEEKFKNVTRRNTNQEATR